jgi:hypothetical protein
MHLKVLMVEKIVLLHTYYQSLISVALRSIFEAWSFHCWGFGARFYEVMV